VCQQQQLLLVMQHCASWSWGVSGLQDWPAGCSCALSQHLVVLVTLPLVLLLVLVLLLLQWSLHFWSESCAGCPLQVLQLPLQLLLLLLVL
jgi:hypothetical protein